MNKNDIDLSDIIKKMDEIINLSIPDDFDKKKNIIKLYKLHQTMFLSKDKKRFENISNILLSSSVSELYGIDKINKEKLEKEKLKEEISSVIFHDGKITNHSDFDICERIFSFCLLASHLSMDELDKILEKFVKIKNN